MFKKSFLSLYFLPDKLYILQLDSGRKKVKKYAIVDLPKGLIVRYKVTDSDLLSKIIKATISKHGFREKSVGIVIPEFSTFNKLLNLPKIRISELDEAVRWQAQEYLPVSSSNLVMDWKIVEKNDEGFEILLVTTEKAILEGYVRASELAGLFPMVVETPSLCLARVAAKNKDPKLIVYKGVWESILMVSEGEKITGTSVVHSTQVSEIVQTAGRMISHYENVVVKKIVIAGVEIDEVAKSLSEKQKLPIEFLTPGIKGISDEVLKELLIPISMQLQDLTEPSDPFSLNLLPANLVDKYKHKRLKLQIWTLTLVVTLFVWTSFLFTLGSYLFMSQQIAAIEAKNESNSQVSQAREKVIFEVKSVNALSDRILKIKKASVFPSQVLNLISAAKPTGVKIQSLRIDMDKGFVVIRGISDNRLSLVSFKQNLEANSDFSTVNIPISSFEAEFDLSFEITFDYIPVSKLNIKK